MLIPINEHSTTSTGYLLTDGTLRIQKERGAKSEFHSMIKSGWSGSIYPTEFILHAKYSLSGQYQSSLHILEVEVVGGWRLQILLHIVDLGL